MMLPADLCQQSRFNEGGADCPPKHGGNAYCLLRLRRFNEGGADCPPKLGAGKKPVPIDKMLQ